MFIDVNAFNRDRSGLAKVETYLGRTSRTIVICTTHIVIIVSVVVSHPAATVLVVTTLVLYEKKIKQIDATMSTMKQRSEL